MSGLSAAEGALGKAERGVGGGFEHQALSIGVVEGREIFEAVPLIRNVLLHQRTPERGFRIVAGRHFAHRGVVTFSMVRTARELTGRASLLTFRANVAHYVQCHRSDRRAGRAQSLAGRCRPGYCRI